MKVAKSKLLARAAAIALSCALLLPGFAQAQGTGAQVDVLGFNSFSMKLSKVVTPDQTFPSNSVELDDPQMPTDKMVVSFTMTPSTTTGWQAGFSFRYSVPNDTIPLAPSSTSYDLNISPSNVALLSSVNGVSTLINGATAPLATSPTSPAHLQLTESGSTFTLVNLTTGQQLFSVNDTSIPYGYSYMLSSPAGSPACTWTNFAVEANGYVQQTFPEAPNAVATIQNFDEDDSANSIMMGNHFFIDNSDCTLFTGQSPMNPVPNNTTPLTFVTCRASGNNTGQKETAYLLFFYADHIALFKEVNGVTQTPSLAQSAPGSISLVQFGKHVNFLLKLKGNTITVSNYETKQQLLTYTDTVNPILSGYRFAAYTEPGFHTCWSAFVLTP